MTKEQIEKIIQEEIAKVLANDNVQLAAALEVEIERMIKERELTNPEKDEKERIVKGMKKSKKDFEERYGEDAESVMYATATKKAKENA
jgi:hypothetical protein